MCENIYLMFIVDKLCTRHQTKSYSNSLEVAIVGEMLATTHSLHPQNMLSNLALFIST